MPRGDGTGPGGAGMGRGGQRRGRMGGNKAGAGPSGFCVCSNCGERVAHTLATPCNQMKCPKCGARMGRE